MEFGYPIYVWLPAAIAMAGGIALMLHLFDRRRGRRVAQFAEAKLMPRLLSGYTGRIRRPLSAFAIIGFIFLAIAIAQPHWGQSWKEINKQSRDILVLLDTSESMNAEAPLPNRLARAKYKIAALMDRLPGDRFGLIAFSGAAALQCPPTNDHGYFKAVLDAINTDTISHEGTDLSAALKQAEYAFEQQDDRNPAYLKDNRVILLISDGEQGETDTQTVFSAAEDAAEFARIYVMGVGDPRGTEVRIPQSLARFGNSVGGMVHLSKLDEDSLIEVAKVGDGRYVRSSADDWDLERIQEFMEKVAARTVQSDVRMRLVNRYQWPLAAAFVCFFAEGLWWAVMPVIRRRRFGQHAEQEGGEAQHA